MTQLQELVVPLRLDDSQFQSGIQGSIQKATTFGSFMGNIAATAVTGAFRLIGTAVEKVGDLITSTITPASNLAESINAVNVVFEEGAGIIAEYGKTSATAVGLSTAKFNQLASVTGAFLTNLGFNSEEAAHKTIELTERASDMASVFNTDVDTALQAIQSGLKGEFNPLEQFGVKMSAATITAKAMEMGLEDVNGELTESAKAQATLAILMEQTDKVAGDFTNTSHQLANMQRILGATFENIKARIGTALLPMLTALGSKLFEISNSPEFQAGLDSLIAKLESIGKWVMDVGIPGFTEFVSKLTEGFREGGLDGLLTVLDEELANLIDDIDWAGLGTKFGDSIEEAFDDGIEGIDFPKFAVSLGNGIKTFLIAAAGEENVKIFKEHFVDYIILQMNNLEKAVTFGFRRMGWDVKTTLNNFELDTSRQFRETMNNLEQTVSQKLRDIAKEFFTRAFAWTQQMVKGFESGKSGLLNKLQGFVDEINSILNQIITSFKINIKFPTLGGGSSGNTGGGTNVKPGRASGGPVIGGQSYNVAEFFRPEIFTPQKSGRIDPMGANQLQQVRITNWEDFNYAELATQVIKGMNNA